MITKADIKYIVSLQLKKQRQKYGQFLVEGEKSIAELLKSEYKIDNIYANREWIAENKASCKKIRTTEVSESELNALSFHQTPQKAIAVVEIPATRLAAKDFNQKLSLALDNIQDPGNMGTIIRIADWYGIKTIICSKGCTDVYSPKCVNSTMGSFARVNVYYEDIISVSQKFGQPIMAAVLDGENIHTMEGVRQGLLVIGNEGHGIDNSILNIAQYRLTIPRYGGAESLNAAVSAAIIVDQLKAKGI